MLHTWKEEVDEINEAARPRAADLHADGDPVAVEVVEVVVDGTLVHVHGAGLEPLGHLGRWSGGSSWMLWYIGLHRQDHSFIRFWLLSYRKMLLVICSLPRLNDSSANQGEPPPGEPPGKTVTESL